MAKLPFYKGGRGGASVVTPKNISAQLAKMTKRRVVGLGTGAVSTATYIVGATERACKVVAINYFGQAAVTGTTLTAEVFARTAAGAAGNTLQASANNIAFASAASAKTGGGATLTATTANLTLAAGQLLEVVVTASSVTAGPGDLLVQVVIVPTEDSLTSNGLVTTGEDL